ncbi:CRTAC1 family protein [Streptosporangium sp. KLBMP 9127]|nr:CRTAC1 family protein [Streptosporangium sp. KLBMP 9127]
MTTAYFVGNPAFPTAQAKAEIGQAYAFTPLSVEIPSGYQEQTIRKVNKDYKDIDAWISSVGAAIAMADVDGDSLSNDLCVVDTRIDQVVITPTPGPAGERYQPFALGSGSLPMNKAIAPMGCVAGDFNEDGRTDLLTYYWGRTPIVHLQQAGATGLSAQTFKPVELVPNAGGATYKGEQWNSNTATVADFDGDGHDDIFIGNYFPHGPVLDDTVSGGVEMNDSLSMGLNGGPNYFFCWKEATADSVGFMKVDDILPKEVSKGWELGATTVDLDADQRPELFLNNDFGPDRLLHNTSKPGKISFSVVDGVERGPWVPKSKSIGHDSFKGMGSDAGDFNGDGLYDFFVSNITTPYGIQESNHHFISTAKNVTDLRNKLNEGLAPFDDRSTDLGTAWTGWAWDVKAEDFNNSGELAIAQANGFVKGDVNKWPQLQELATANDLVTRFEQWWPNVTEGADLAGHQPIAFFVKGKDGKYANLSETLGLDVQIPTRGIATGDANGDGLVDLAVARQFGPPAFYQNQSPSPGAYLGLRLIHEGTASTTGQAAGSPVIGAQAKVTTADGRTILGRVDGGSGHSGKRSHEVHLGLGQNVTGPVKVHLSWRDRSGVPHEQDIQLAPGRHTIQLGTQAKEK